MQNVHSMLQGVACGLTVRPAVMAFRAMLLTCAEACLLHLVYPTTLAPVSTIATTITSR